MSWSFMGVKGLDYMTFEMSKEWGHCDLKKPILNYDSQPLSKNYKSFEVQGILINCLKVIPQFCTAHRACTVHKNHIIQGRSTPAF